MRFSTLASAALLSLASAQDAYPVAASDSSLVTTWTMTRTVQRVVETVTATRNTSALTTSAAADTTTLASYTTSSPPLGTASMGVYPQSNGTSTVLGTGASPSNGSTPTGGFPESGAERVGLQMVGLMAVVGFVGLVGL
jgi:hypothetical protein